MWRKIAVSIIVLLGVIVADMAAAQEKKTKQLTLDECIKRALTNSRTLAAERHRLAILDAQVKQAFWAPFSGFSLNAFGSWVPDKCVDKEHLEATGSVRDCKGGVSGEDNIFEDGFWTGGWGPSLQLEISGGVPIYTFGKISSGKEAVEHARAAKQAEYPRFEDAIRYQVAQAYQAVSGAREMLYTINKGREHLEKARKKVEQDLENQEGTSTEIDLIKLKVFEGEVDQYETQSREIERVGLAGLRFLVGGKERSLVDIIDEPQSQTPEEIGKLDEYKKEAVQNRPELKAVRHAAKALAAKVDMRRADFWPDLLVVGGFRYGWTPGKTDLHNWALKDNYNYGPSIFLGLAVSYKLDLGLDIYRLDEAQAELSALTTEQKAALEGVVLEVEKIYHHAVATRDALESMQKSRRLVKGWIAAVMQNHATGLASAKEVKDALAEYFKVMAAIHKLTHDYNVGLAEIHRVTGVSRVKQ
ncbi:MAG: TolC family protein [Deltaproteobacteria bacterium]|nr:TolC family protein [Deltaproteobacteria bacterium]